MIARILGMDGRRLAELMDEYTEVVEHSRDSWRVEYRGRVVFITVDGAHDRLRMMTPVEEERLLDEDDLRTLLAANFDRALDARFALADEFLWSVFMHPLRDLTERLFLDALEQLTTLADNYGGSYSSSDLFFAAD
ncbi:MAG: hypothetical protein WD066_10810 [Planctomycetaceae bacterium]